MCIKFNVKVANIVPLKWAAEGLEITLKVHLISTVVDLLDAEGRL